MSETAAQPDRVPQNGRSLSLWVGVIGAPMVWATQLQAGYTISQFVCGNGMSLWSHVVTLVAMILTIVAAVLCWREWKRLGAGSTEETEGGPVPREWFLSVLGFALSCLMTLVILLQGAASFFLDGCWM